MNIDWSIKCNHDSWWKKIKQVNILPSNINKSWIIKQAKFTYSLQVKTFQKQGRMEIINECNKDKIMTTEKNRLI